MVSRYSVYRRGWAAVSPNVIDRILVGVCVAVWLVLVGMSVAAIVALVDLGRGFHRMTGNSHTTWVLYAIIVVSALVIMAAIPLLLRARRTAEPTVRSVDALAGRVGRQQVRSGYRTGRTVGAQARTERLIGIGPAAEASAGAVDRVWLRGTAALIGTMGAALIAVAAATYLMAIGRDGASWTSYAIAGILTAVLPAIPWRHVRHLRCILAAHRPAF